VQWFPTSVEIHNAVSGFIRSTPTDSAGKFAFNNVPFNPYHLSVTAEGFGSFAQDVDVRSNVPLAVKISLQVASSTTTVTVESGADLLETDPSAHTDVDRGLFDKLPLESQSSSVSSLVTLASSGVVADSNGLFHGLGDSGTTRRTRFPSTASPSPTSRAKYFRTNFPSKRSSHWKSSPARRPLNSVTKPAS
jgi:Carboxypeptidase regulatory-like domain